MTHPLRRVAIGLAFSLSVVACSDDTTSLDDGNNTVANDALQNLPRESPVTGPDNIVDTAVAAGSFTTLVAALQATGLDAVLADTDRSFTVFAPTDDAFAALGQDTINDLLADTETLTDILLYHVIPDATVDAETAISLDGTTATAANEDELAINVVDGTLFINESEVITADVGASNGIIHAIDTVLMPPQDMAEGDAVGTIVEVAAAAGFNTLTAALQATGLDAVLADTEREFTVFAPTDAAFDALGEDTINALLADPDTLSRILLYHVLADQAVDSTTAISLAGETVVTANGETVALSLRDGSLFINDSAVTTVDVAASNGIIHVIDQVLLPAGVERPATDEGSDTSDADARGDDMSNAHEDGNTSTPVADGDTSRSDDGTVFDVAGDAGFDTLVAAIEVAGLTGALDHPDDTYTVFAPTDEAFAALGQDTIDALLADPDALRNILLYHVLPGTIVSAEQATGLVGIDIGTGSGQNVRFSQRDGDLFVNDSRITSADIPAVNGVIHVIDTVLLPPAP